MATIKQSTSQFFLLSSFKHSGDTEILSQTNSYNNTKTHVWKLFDSRINIALIVVSMKTSTAKEPL